MGLPSLYWLNHFYFKYLSITVICQLDMLQLYIYWAKKHPTETSNR